MNLIWETSTKVRAFDVDAYDRLKVNAILDYFQDAASIDAERRNFGYSNFAHLRLIWVLSWAKFEFIKYPKFSDELKIQTWGKKQYKLYSIRDYLLFNSEDEIICKGTSAWLLIDTKSLRPKILPQLFPELKMLDSKDALSDLPQKIVPSSKTDIIYSTLIRYSDIDLNQHANNSKYIELMLDCFDQEFHKMNKLKTLTVLFNAQSKYGEQVQLCKSKVDGSDAKYYIETQNLSTNKTVCQALMEWY